MEDKIFKYIDPNKNDIFSDFRGSDLQDLLVLIDECNIRYREKLNLLKGKFNEVITVIGTWINTWKTKVAEFVSKCLTCQKVKFKYRRP